MIGLAHVCIESANLDATAWMVTRRDPNGVFIKLHEYDARNMQRHGGVCLIDYVPRPRAP